MPFAPSLQFKLLLALLGALALFGSGLYVGVEWELGKQARIEAKERSQIIDSLIAQRDFDQATAEMVHDLLEAERDARRRDGMKWERKLRDIKPSSLAICLPPSVGVSSAPSLDQASDSSDRVALTLDFVGLWNDALCAGNGSPECTGRATDEAFKAGYVVPKDVLANLAANAQGCADDRALVAGWQAWAKQQGLTGK